MNGKKKEVLKEIEENLFEALDMVGGRVEHQALDKEMKRKLDQCRQVYDPDAPENQDIPVPDLEDGYISCAMSASEDVLDLAHRLSLKKRRKIH
ncbi:MAG: hypothetical protein ACTSRC_18735 [Candidatus Helarchaeota archaeon]